MTPDEEKKVLEAAEWTNLKKNAQAIVGLIVLVTVLAVLFLKSCGGGI